MPASTHTVAEQLFLTVEQAATVYGDVAPATIRRLCREGRFEAAFGVRPVRVGGRWFIPRVAGHRPDGSPIPFIATTGTT